MSTDLKTSGQVDEAQCRSFELAWSNGTPAPLAKCLPATDASSYLPTLEELVHIELAFAWPRWADAKRAQRTAEGLASSPPPLLECYLQQFAVLDDAQQLTRLLQQEYFQRRRCGVRAPMAEYCRRFPSLFGAEQEAVILLQQENSLLDKLTPGADTTGPGESEVPTQDGETVAFEPVTLSRPENEVRKVAGYRIVGELGRGGMGVVYKALDPKLNRIVALKMVLSGDHAGPTERARFHREAMAIAQLQHPHIVQIFEVGEESGLPFFVLEFIRGGSLDRHIGGKPRSPRQSATLVETLARAMQAAHERGFVHRDLKPANVLMAPGRVPKVTDFGLAKQLEDAEQRTGTGAVMGTPSFMAPEQAAGETSQIGPAADIYALGAILYNMLTGRPPFQGASSYDTIMQVIEQDPVPPADLQPKLPSDLQTICLKCLQKEPERRYESAEALADDLRRFLERKPILARPVGWIERGIKWARRQPSLAALIGALLVITVTGWGLAVSYNDSLALERGQADLNKELKKEKRAADDSRRKAEVNATAARQNADKAEKKTLEAQQNLALVEAERERLAEAQYKTDMGMAASDWNQKNLGRLDERLRKYAPGKERIDRRQFEWYFWTRRCRQDLVTFRGHERAISTLTCSPDGTWIASGSLDSTIRLWHATSGTLARTLEGHTKAISQLAFSPDGRTLVSTGLDHSARFWNVASGEETIEIKNVSSVGGIALAPDGSSVAIGHRDGTVKFWTLTGQPLPWTLQPHQDDETPVSTGLLAISPDGRFLAASCSFSDPTVVVFDLPNRKQIYSRTVKWPRIFALAFSPDSKTFAVAGRGVHLWESLTGKHLGRYKPHDHSATRSMAFLGDQQQMVTGSNDNTIRLWQTDTPNEGQIQLGHHRPVIALAVHPDQRRLFSGSEDATIKAWRIPIEDHSIQVQAQLGSENPIEALSRMTIEDSGRQLYAGTLDGQLLTIDKAGRRAVGAQSIGNSQIMTLAPVPGSGHIVAGCRNGRVLVWDPEKKQARHTLQAHEGITYCVAVSGDGRRLATGGQDRKVHLWDLDSGRRIHELSWPGQSVHALSFHPNGNLVAGAGQFGKLDEESIILWNCQDGSVAQTFVAPGSLRSYCVTFSHNGGSLAAGDSQGMITVWNVKTGEIQSNCSGHALGVRSLQFSPDGHRLASSGDDGSIRLWDPVDGTELLTLSNDERGSSISDIVFADDGQQLVSLTARSQTIQFWDARPLKSQ